MYSPNPDSSSFGELRPLLQSGSPQPEPVFSNVEYNCQGTNSPAAAPKPMSLKLLDHLEKKPRSAEIERNIAAYYDKLCALSDSPATA